MNQQELRDDFEKQIRENLKDVTSKASEFELRRSLMALAMACTLDELRTIFAAIAAYKPERA